MKNKLISVGITAIITYFGVGISMGSLNPINVWESLRFINEFATKGFFDGWGVFILGFLLVSFIIYIVLTKLKVLK